MKGFCPVIHESDFMLQYMLIFICFDIVFFSILTDDSSAKEVSRVSEASLLCVRACVCVFVCVGVPLTL